MIDSIESSPDSSQISSHVTPNIMTRLNGRDIRSHVLSILLVCMVLTSVVFSLRLLYHLALPRPIPAIPYNEESARKLLGDISGMTPHIKNAKLVKGLTPDHHIHLQTNAE